MNIAIIVNGLHGGEVDRMAALLSCELSKDNNVYIFLFGLRDVVYQYKGTLVDISKCGSFFEYAIKKYKEFYNIDVAISFIDDMNFANIRSKGKERVIVSERKTQSKVRDHLPAREHKIQKYYPHADTIVACSYGVEYDLKTNYGLKENISTIYNFVDKDMIIRESRENLPDTVRNFLGNAPFFVNIGHLHEQKNQKGLIRQFAFFHKENKDVKLIILGSGSEETELNEFIEEEKLGSVVKIFSYTVNPFAFVSKAKALIVSDRYEGLPDVVLKAMTIGCPVISTDCLAGSRELLGDITDYEMVIPELYVAKRGILVKDIVSGDKCESHCMADAMEMVISDRDLCTHFVNNQFEYMSSYLNENILNQWMALISKETYTLRDVISEENEGWENYDNLFIYGAGYVGMTCYLRFREKYSFSGFVVTKKKAQDTSFDIPMFEIDEISADNSNTLFIVGVGDRFQDAVVYELKQRGYTNIVFPWIPPYEYEYFLFNDCDINKELPNWYRIRTGKDIDLENPVTYNEKIQWLKIHDDLPIKKTLVDKLLVREYVKEKIGERYLIPVLGIWNGYDEIDFASLPQKFALKCNNGSGTNIVVMDKDKLDHTENKRVFDAWQEMKYEWRSGFEMQYAGTESKVFAEELLCTEDGGEIKDYKLFVFGGKVKLIQVDIDRQHNHRRNLYTTDWKYLPYSIKYPTAPDETIERPSCLDELISVAEKLGEGFIHVRADFYLVKNKIYFGELTFSHGSGIEQFMPEEFGVEMGSWMQLEGRIDV